MHYLIHSRDPETGEKLGKERLRAEAGLLFAAGTDTTANTMAGCFFYLTRQPRVLDKLQREIRTTFTTIHDIKAGPKLQSLTYLRAVIDESLRLVSPVAEVLMRKALPGGITVDGHFLPQDTKMGVSAYIIHRNETYFSRPFDFIPERWIEGSSENDTGFPVTPTSVELAKRALIPFSVGPRNCIGKNMAILEMSVAMARAMWLLDVREVDGPEGRIGEGGQSDELGRGRKGEFQLKNWFISEVDGPVVEFRKREEAEL